MGELRDAGHKDDAEKERFDLLEVGPVRAVVRVLTRGAQRYGVGNWKAVPEARRRYYAAALRHITAWWEGEQLDPDDGEHHLAHAACCLLFLMWFDLNRK